MAKKLGRNAEGPSVVHRRGFPEARLDALAEVDGRLAKKLARKDDNEDGRVQVGELVDAKSAAFAKRYMDAVEQLRARDGIEAPPDATTHVARVGVGGVSAGASTAWLIGAAAEVASAAAGGPPTNVAMLAMIAVPALSFVVGGTVAIGQGAKAALDGVARLASPDHRAFRRLLDAP